MRDLITSIVNGATAIRKNTESDLQKENEDNERKFRENPI